MKKCLSILIICFSFLTIFIPSLGGTETTIETGNKKGYKELDVSGTYTNAGDTGVSEENLKKIECKTTDSNDVLFMRKDLSENKHIYSGNSGGKLVVGNAQGSGTYEAEINDTNGTGLETVMVHQNGKVTMNSGKVKNFVVKGGTAYIKGGTIGGSEEGNKKGTGLIVHPNDSENNNEVKVNAGTVNLLEGKVTVAATTGTSCVKLNCDAKIENSRKLTADRDNGAIITDKDEEVMNLTLNKDTVAILNDKSIEINSDSARNIELNSDGLPNITLKEKIKATVIGGEIKGLTVDSGASAEVKGGTVTVKSGTVTVPRDANGVTGLTINGDAIVEIENGNNKVQSLEDGSKIDIQGQNVTATNGRLTVPKGGKVTGLIVKEGVSVEINDSLITNDSGNDAKLNIENIEDEYVTVVSGKVNVKEYKTGGSIASLTVENGAEVDIISGTITIESGKVKVGANTSDAELTIKEDASVVTGNETVISSNGTETRVNITGNKNITVKSGTAAIIKAVDGADLNLNINKGAVAEVNSDKISVEIGNNTNEVSSVTINDGTVQVKAGEAVLKGKTGMVETLEVVVGAAANIEGGTIKNLVNNNTTTDKVKINGGDVTVTKGDVTVPEGAVIESLTIKNAVTANIKGGTIKKLTRYYQNTTVNKTGGTVERYEIVCESSDAYNNLSENIATGIKNITSGKNVIFVRSISSGTFEIKTALKGYEHHFYDINSLLVATGLTAYIEGGTVTIASGNTSGGDVIVPKGANVEKLTINADVNTKVTINGRVNKVVANNGADITVGVGGEITELETNGTDENRVINVNNSGMIENFIKNYDYNSRDKKVLEYNSNQGKGIVKECEIRFNNSGDYWGSTNPRKDGVKEGYVTGFASICEVDFRKVKIGMNYASKGNFFHKSGLLSYEHCYYKSLTAISESLKVQKGECSTVKMEGKNENVVDLIVEEGGTVNIKRGTVKRLTVQNGGIANIEDGTIEKFIYADGIVNIGGGTINYLNKNGTINLLKSLKIEKGSVESIEPTIADSLREKIDSYLYREIICKDKKSYRYLADHSDGSGPEGISNNRLFDKTVIKIEYDDNNFEISSKLSKYKHDFGDKDIKKLTGNDSETSISTNREQGIEILGGCIRVEKGKAVVPEGVIIKNLVVEQGVSIVNNGTIDTLVESRGGTGYLNIERRGAIGNYELRCTTAKYYGDLNADNVCAKGERCGVFDSNRIKIGIDFENFNHVMHGKYSLEHYLYQNTSSLNLDDSTDKKGKSIVTIKGGTIGTGEEGVTLAGHSVLYVDGGTIKNFKGKGSDCSVIVLKTLEIENGLENVISQTTISESLINYYLYKEIICKDKESYQHLINKVAELKQETRIESGKTVIKIEYSSEKFTIDSNLAEYEHRFYENIEKLDSNSLNEVVVSLGRTNIKSSNAVKVQCGFIVVTDCADIKKLTIESGSVEVLDGANIDELTITSGSYAEINGGTIRNLTNDANDESNVIIKGGSVKITKGNVTIPEEATVKRIIKHSYYRIGIENKGTIKEYEIIYGRVDDYNDASDDNIKEGMGNIESIKIGISYGSIIDERPTFVWNGNLKKYEHRFYYDWGNLDVPEGCTVTIKSGTITNLTVNNNSTVTVEGGDVTVTSGKVTVPADAGIIESLTIREGASADIKGGNVTINGGTITIPKGADVKSLTIGRQSDTTVNNSGTIKKLKIENNDNVSLTYTNSEGGIVEEYTCESSGRYKDLAGNSGTYLTNGSKIGINYSDDSDNGFSIKDPLKDYEHYFYNDIGTLIIEGSNTATIKKGTIDKLQVLKKGGESPSVTVEGGEILTLDAGMTDAGVTVIGGNVVIEKGKAIVPTNEGIIESLKIKNNASAEIEGGTIEKLTVENKDKVTITGGRITVIAGNVKIDTGEIESLTIGSDASAEITGGTIKNLINNKTNADGEYVTDNVTITAGEVTVTEGGVTIPQGTVLDELTVGSKTTVNNKGEIKKLIREVDSTVQGVGTIEYQEIKCEDSDKYKKVAETENLAEKVNDDVKIGIYYVSDPFEWEETLINFEHSFYGDRSNLTIDGGYRAIIKEGTITNLIAQNGSTVTVEGGTVESLTNNNTETDAASKVNIEGGTVTVTSGGVTVPANAGRIESLTIKAGASTDIKGGTVESLTIGEGASANIIGGTVKSLTNSNTGAGAASKVNIEGGTVTVTSGGVTVPANAGIIESLTIKEGASTDIRGGTVESLTIEANASADITGGTVESLTNNNTVTDAASKVNIEGGTVTVTSGGVTVPASAGRIESLTIGNGASADIEGGTVESLINNNTVADAASKVNVKGGNIIVTKGGVTVPAGADVVDRLLMESGTSAQINGGTIKKLTRDCEASVNKKGGTVEEHEIVCKNEESSYTNLAGKVSTYLISDKNVIIIRYEAKAFEISKALEDYKHYFEKNVGSLNFVAGTEEAPKASKATVEFGQGTTAINAETGTTPAIVLERGNISINAGTISSLEVHSLANATISGGKVTINRGVLNVRGDATINTNVGTYTNVVSSQSELTGNGSVYCSTSFIKNGDGIFGGDLSAANGITIKGKVLEGLLNVKGNLNLQGSIEDSILELDGLGSSYNLSSGTIEKSNVQMFDLTSSIKSGCTFTDNCLGIYGDSYITVEGRINQSQNITNNPVTYGLSRVVIGDGKTKVEDVDKDSEENYEGALLKMSQEAGIYVRAYYNGNDVSTPTSYLKVNRNGKLIMGNRVTDNTGKDITSSTDVPRSDYPLIRGSLIIDGNAEMNNGRIIDTELEKEPNELLIEKNGSFTIRNGTIDIAIKNKGNIKFVGGKFTKNVDITDGVFNLVDYVYKGSESIKCVGGVLVIENGDIKVDMEKDQESDANEFNAAAIEVSGTGSVLLKNSSVWGSRCAIRVKEITGVSSGQGNTNNSLGDFIEDQEIRETVAEESFNVYVLGKDSIIKGNRCGIILLSGILEFKEGTICDSIVGLELDDDKAQVQVGKNSINTNLINANVEYATIKNCVAGVYAGVMKIGDQAKIYKTNILECGSGVDVSGIVKDGSSAATDASEQEEIELRDVKINKCTNGAIVRGTGKVRFNKVVVSNSCVGYKIIPCSEDEAKKTTPNYVTIESNNSNVIKSCINGIDIEFEVDKDKIADSVKGIKFNNVDIRNCGIGLHCLYKKDITSNDIYKDKKDKDNKDKDNKDKDNKDIIKREIMLDNTNRKKEEHCKLTNKDNRSTTEIIA